MAAGSRDRVTVDLRGAGHLVQAKATAQGLTVAAFVRRAVMTIVEVPADPADAHTVTPRHTDQRLVKVTLRLPLDHAAVLAMRARSAEVSQGSYVAGLLEGGPPPRVATDRREATAAMVKSTDQLAVMSTDVQAVLRLIRMGSAERAEPYRAKVQSLLDDVRAHLDLACRYLADLQRTTPARTGQRSRRGND